MRKTFTSISIIFMIILGMALSAYSMDACEEGRKALIETTAQYKEYFERYIVNHNASGYARIYDLIETRSANTYQIELSCDGDIFITLTSNSGFLKSLKKGDEVKYSGEIMGWNKAFYPGINKLYIRIILGPSTISY